MKVVVFTLGCKVNQYESDAILEGLNSCGYECSSELCVADVYVLNSCAVTNEAERKSRQIIAKFLKLNPKAKVVVCGCASQNNSQQFEKIKGVKYISGTANKLKIIENLLKKSNKIEQLPNCYEDCSLSKSSNTRAYVKIQDGCNRFCSYCLIPYVRGRSRSRDIVSIIKEVDALEQNGAKEIVLTGIDISDFKIDNELALGVLLDKLKYFNVRIRLGSIEVGLITNEILKILKSMKNFCPHFHISMQSGSDSVLKRMNRHYTSTDFIQAVKKIRKTFSNCAITTDVIVGFPGETDKEFLETVETINKSKFSAMHIFPYSKRSGTAAVKMLGKNGYEQIDGNIVKQRVKILEEINEKLKNKFAQQNIGKILTVLIEEKDGNYYVGHTENYLKCYVENEEKLNQLVKVKIKSICKDGVVAEKIKGEKDE